LVRMSYEGEREIVNQGPVNQENSSS